MFLRSHRTTLKPVAVRAGHIEDQQVGLEMRNKRPPQDS